MIRITGQESPEFKEEAKQWERTPPCRSCGEEGKFIIRIENETPSGNTVMCRRCLRELAARSASAVRLFASERKILLAAESTEDTECPKS